MKEMNFVGKQVGNYSIGDEINSGAFGRVYQAKHLLLSQRIVAIKLLHAYLGSAKERDQFLQEAQFLERLRYRYILPILDVGFLEGFPYIMTEYAAKGSLRDRLKQQAGRPLPLAEALPLLSQIGQALDYAHQQNIIHRDLKPENILFNAEGEVLLADFGIAIVLVTSSVKLIDATGTPAYMAPEQFRGMVSKESDQYALGCIAYEMLTGRRLFTAPDFVAMGFLHAAETPAPLTRYNPQLPNFIEKAVLKALAKGRGDRYANISAFVAGLNTVNFVETVLPAVISTEKRGEGLLNEGKKYVESHRYNEALEIFERVLKIDSKNAEAFIEQGKSLSHLGRHEKALIAYEQATKLDPPNAIYHNKRGNALSNLKRHEEALTAYEQALYLNPHNALFWYNKGISFYNLKRSKEALAAYDQALRLDPSYTSAWSNKGVVLYEIKRYEEALAAYEQALRLDPSYTSAWSNKGLVLYDLGRYEGALVATEQTLYLDPKYTKAWYHKGLILSNLKRYEQALAAFEQALRLDPKYVKVWNHKSKILYKLNRPKEAQEAQKQAQLLQLLQK